MTDDVWRPFGIDSEEDVAEYDALHDGIPAWMGPAFWTWIRDSFTVYRSYPDGSGQVAMLNVDLAERLCQELKIPLQNLRVGAVDRKDGQTQLQVAVETVLKYNHPLRIADYLMAHGGKYVVGADLNRVLTRSKSVWEVGERFGKPGLVRRVPLGVQISSDSVMQRAGRAGVRLAKAWEQLYGVDPSPSEAYRLAILAVEDAAVPVVSPTNTSATLGTVLKQIEDQKDWKLPMMREHGSAPSGQVLVGMMRMLWHGQHDRHGGQPSAPGDVSIEEATLAVSLAVTLVHWFDAGLVKRQ